MSNYLEIGSLPIAINLRISKWDNLGFRVGHKSNGVIIRERKGRFGEQRHIEQKAMWRQSSDCGYIAQIRVGLESPEAGRDEGFSPKSLWNKWSLQHLNFRRLVSTTMRKISFVLSHQLCGNFLIAALGNWYKEYDRNVNVLH